MQLNMYELMHSFMSVHVIPAWKLVNLALLTPQATNESKWSDSTLEDLLHRFAWQRMKTGEKLSGSRASSL